MALILLNYIMLGVAMSLPTLSLKILHLSDAATNSMLMGSLGMVLLTAMTLSQKNLSASDGVVYKHAQNQKSILLIFVVGGIISSLRLFLKYEQFRPRFDLDWPLLIAAALLCLSAAMMVVLGLVALIASLLSVHPETP